MADLTKFNGQCKGSKLANINDIDTESFEQISVKIPIIDENSTNNTHNIFIRPNSLEYFQKNDVLVGKRLLVNCSNNEPSNVIECHESLISVNKINYKNDLIQIENSFNSELKSDTTTEYRKFLNFSIDDQESGSKIYNYVTKEGLKINQQLPQKSSIYYKDDSILSSQKLKNIFNSEKDELFDCSKFKKTDVSVNEHSTEKLVNGSIKSRSSNTKQIQHHVQFNRKIFKENEKHHQKNYNIEEKSRASPSISVSSSSEDNISLGHVSEARPPDGGWGWVIVAASFMVNLIADGITFSFGVIYHEFLNYFGEGKATTSWIGSLFMAMPLLSGPIASFLTDRYGCRKVTIAGSILATTGFVISYFANSMGVLILTFGVLAGFGLSLCFVAAVVIVAYYFDKRRSFATGLSVCGSGIGTFIFPPLIQKLLSEYGWRGTTLILAGLFLNLAVCGCLMKDLEWTTIRARVKTQERRRNREKKRLKVQNSSTDSFSAINSANTTQTMYRDKKRTFTSSNTIIIESLGRQDKLLGEKLFSSLVSLPTFIKNGEKVPMEVLELLSTRKNVYNVLMQNYPSLLISSRSFSDSGGLRDQMSTTTTTTKFLPIVNTLVVKKKENLNKNLLSTQECIKSELDSQINHPSHNWWLRKFSPDAQVRRASTSDHLKRLQTAYFKDIRMHRHSLTYRGAMLNINRYRLRASSCPDIYRNSMTTIAKQKMVWYAGFWEFRDLLVDMLDLSHFTESHFLLFSISNFLLHTWYDVPYMYLTDNAIEMGFSDTDASYLISVIGIMNMIGEILLGWLGDRAWVNASMVYAICMTLCGAFTTLIPLVIKCYYLLSIIAGAFGFFIAANYSLTSIILVQAITLDRFTNAYGLLLLVQGIANLMGPPMAGWLYDITGTYDLSFYLAGSFIGISGMMLMVMPIADMYKRFKKSRKRISTTSRNFSDINNV